MPIGFSADKNKLTRRTNNTQRLWHCLTSKSGHLNVPHIFPVYC
jgi:hypothetical protein